MAQHGRPAQLRSVPYLLLVTILSVLPVLHSQDTDAPQLPAGGNAAAAKPLDKGEVYYVNRMGDRFLSFVEKHKAAVRKFHDAELKRLEARMQETGEASDKELLEQSAIVSEENRLESENAFSEMKNFVTTLKQAMGAVGSAQSCKDLTCGTHAFCSMTPDHGATCMCKAGYDGNGFVCKPPITLTAYGMALSQVGALASASLPKVSDLHVTAVNKNVVAVVYQSQADAQRGYVVLGRALEDQMDWQLPVLFSGEAPAFGPQISLLETSGTGSARSRHQFALAFRDQNRGGHGILLGGSLELKTGALSFGAPLTFAHNQAQGMSVLPMPDSRIAVIYAEHNLGGNAKSISGGAMYGTALLAKMHGDRARPEIISKERFAAGPVARITATLISPSSFAIAYRQGDAGFGGKQAEAACIVGNLRGPQLKFDAPVALLEPHNTQIWSRSLTLVGENTLAYTYHSGNERLSKQVILKADPKTHQLKAVHGPEVLADDMAPIVGSVAFLANGTKLNLLHHQTRTDQGRLFTFLSRNGIGGAHVRICALRSNGVPSNCRQLRWEGKEISSVSGAPVDDGRYVFVFTDVTGVPYYQFVGLDGSHDI